MTSPDWVPTMRRAAAVVTDGGGMTCHAAIVSRELGVPAVVGARNATTVLREGELVTVDGAQGVVTEGATAAAPRWSPEPSASRVDGDPGVLATRIYVNLAFAEHAEEVAALPVDGVGLLRAEFMVTDALGGVHPRLLLERGEQKSFVESMAKSLLQITRAFEPRPVVYRSIDFRSNEFANLEGGEKFEPNEENPMIGYRGCYRYVREPDLFRLELDVLSRVLEETANVVLMIPFVRTAWELEACLELVDDIPVGGSLPVVGHGRGAVGRLLDPDLCRHGDHRGLHRQQRPDTAHARCRSGLADMRRCLRRGRSGRPRCHRPHHRWRQRGRDHIVAVRAGAVEQACLRRAPGAARHHVDLGEPRCRHGRSQAVAEAEWRMLLEAAVPGRPRESAAWHTARPSGQRPRR